MNINSLVRTIVTVFIAIIISTSVAVQTVSAENVTLGVTRFVDPQQYYTFRYVGIELQKYLVNYLKKASNVYVVHRRAADQLLFNASADDIQQIYTIDTLHTINSILQADLILLGNVDVVNDDRVVVQYKLVRAVDKQTVYEGKSEGVVDALIELFNTITLNVVQHADKQFKGESITFDEDVLDELKSNTELSLFAYNAFAEVDRYLAKEQYNLALEKLETMIYENRNLERIYQLIVHCYKQMSKWNDAFTWIVKLYELKHDQISDLDHFKLYYTLLLREMERKNHKQALVYLATCQEIVKKNNEEHLALQLQFQSSKLQYEINQISTAKEELTKLLETLKKNQQYALVQCETNLLLGGLNFKEWERETTAGNKKKALEYLTAAESFFKDAVTVARSTEDAPTIIKSLLKLGAYYLSTNDKDKTKETVQEALTLAELIQDPSLLFQTHEAMGNLYELSVMFPKALEQYKIAFTYSKAVMDVEAVRNVAYKIGFLTQEICTSLSPETKAMLDHHLQLSKIFEQMMDEYYTFKNIASVLETVADYNQSLEFIIFSNEIHQKMESAYGQIRDKNQIADMYVRMEEYDRAFLTHTEALKMAEKLQADPLIQDKPMVIREFFHIGTIYFLKGEVQNAIEIMEKALSDAHQLGMRALEFEIVYKMAQLYKRQNQTGKYQEYLNNAIEIGKKLGDPQVALMQQELNL